MPKTMPRRLVALSASAVATIYAAGMLSTRAVAQNEAVTAAAETPVVPTFTPSLLATGTPSVVVGASATATPTTPATTTPSVAATPSATATASTSSYADGTYTGTGTSRFGNVTVSVTISGGVISNVQITRVTTSYPVSRIASLPALVVQNQTANVNVVTGATYSSQAFRQAVQQALGQALTA